MLFNIRNDNVQAISYFIESGKSHPAAFVFRRAAFQSVEDGVDEKRQSGDPLHGQHQETVHGQRLAHGTGFKSSQHFDKLRFILPVERQKESLVS